MRPEYGVYSVVIPQAEALAYFGNDVTLFVSEDFEKTGPFPFRFPENIISATVPARSKFDYQSEKDLTQEHDAYVNHFSKWLLDRAAEGFDCFITHDWVYTGWNLPYFLAMEKVREETRHIKWLHWCHSIPGGEGRDWWNLRRLGERNHKLVYPNKTAKLRLANYFQTEAPHVFAIPHIVDLRHLFNWSDDTLDFLDNHPEMMDAQIVQVYPASSDRLDPKGVRELILLFAKLKERGFSVCLVICTSQIKGMPERQEKIQHLLRIGRRNGLIPGEELIFTSEEDEKYEGGIPKRMLIELAQCSNVFVFPSQHETFGLILPEVVLASGALPILNRSLAEMLEVGGHFGLMTEFGSYYIDWQPKDENAWLDHLAGIVIAQLRAEQGNMSRTFFRRYYNKSTVYYRYYVPILEGSELW